MADPTTKSEFNVQNLHVQRGHANTGSNEPLDQQALTGKIRSRKARITELERLAKVAPNKEEFRDSIERCKAEIDQCEEALKQLKKA